MSDDEVMLHVADQFIYMHDCTRLAVHLGVARGANFVTDLVQGNPRMLPTEVAFKVLKQSLLECGKTAFLQRLRSALSAEANWKDILEKFNELVG